MDPSGCYVIVFDRPAFSGRVDVLNGPGQWPALEALVAAGRASAPNKARSLRVGQTATATVYTDRSFGGDKRQFAAGTSHPQLDPALSGRIQSVDLACK